MLSCFQAAPQTESEGGNNAPEDGRPGAAPEPVPIQAEASAPTVKEKVKCWDVKTAWICVGDDGHFYLHSPDGELKLKQGNRLAGVGSGTLSRHGLCYMAS